MGEKCLSESQKSPDPIQNELNPFRLHLRSHVWPLRGPATGFDAS